MPSWTPNSRGYRQAPPVPERVISAQGVQAVVELSCCIVRRMCVLGGLALACVTLGACGGSAMEPPATRTTVPPPVTLPSTLPAVESFFDGQGGRGWLKTGLLSPSLYQVSGMALDNDTCPTSIIGPGGTTGVSAIDLHCASGGPPNTTLQQAVAVSIATVQRFAPSGASWAERTLTANISGSYTRTFGDAIVEVDIATNVQTVTLNIIAKGF